MSNKTVFLYGKAVFSEDSVSNSIFSIQSLVFISLTEITYFHDSNPFSNVAETEIARRLEDYWRGADRQRSADMWNLMR